MLVAIDDGADFTLMMWTTAVEPSAAAAYAGTGRAGTRRVGRSRLALAGSEC